MENQSDCHRSVPCDEGVELFDNNCVPVHHEDITQSFIYRNRWMNVSFDSNDCHQLVPSANGNHENSLPAIVFNHITDYWISMPLTNDRFFPDDTVDLFIDFDPIMSPDQSRHNHDEENNTNVDYDADLYINGDLISFYSPVSSSSASSINHESISDGSYDHPFIVD